MSKSFELKGRRLWAEPMKFLKPNIYICQVWEQGNIQNGLPSLTKNAIEKINFE